MNSPWIVARVLVGLVLLAAAGVQQEPVAPIGTTQVTSVEGLLAALADIEMRVTVDRDFDGGERALDERLEATRAQASATWLEDPRIVAAVGRIRTGIRQAREVDRSGLVDEVLRTAAQWDTEALRRLGDPAFDVVRDLIVAGVPRTWDLGTPERPNVRKLAPVDVLGLAYETDKHRATDILLETREQLRARGVVLLKLIAQFLQQQHWQIVPGSALPPDERLLEVLAEELAGVQTVSQLTLDFQTLAKCDAWTPAQCQELARVVRGSRWRDAESIARAVVASGGVWIPSAEPFVRSLLEDERDEVRRFAADVVAHGANDDLLLPHATDPDAGVRRSVARSLRTRSVDVWVFERRGVWPDVPRRIAHPLSADPRYRDVLQRLAGDPDAGVREEAARSLIGLADVPDADVLRTLARDPDAGVRTVMAKVEHPSPDVVADIFATLALDNEPLVLEAVDERLSSADLPESLAQIMPVLRVRAAHPTWPFGRLIDYDIASLLEVIALTPEGRQELSRWSVETGDPGPLVCALDVIRPPGANGHDPEDLNIWLALGPQEIAKLLPMVHARQPQLASGLLETLERSQRREPLAAAIDPLVADGTQAAELRLQLASFVLRVEATPERVQVARDLLASSAVREWEPELDWKQNYIGGVASGVPQPRRNALILDLVESEGLSSAVASLVLAAYSPAEPGGEELTRLVLERWLDEARPGSWNALDTAVGALGELRDPASAEFLRRAVRRTETCRQAVEAIARRPEPEFTVLLGECIASDWMSNEQVREQMSQAAIRLLTSRLTTEAGEMLLAGAARAPTSACRDAALRGVGTIRGYLDSVDEWQRRKASSATRDAAVVRLVDLLNSPMSDVRIEALRGLGSLRAVEHLPEIIEALKDNEAKVREAARQALDRLNEPPAAAAAPAGSAPSDG